MSCSVLFQSFRLEQRTHYPSHVSHWTLLLLVPEALDAVPAYIFRNVTSGDEELFIPHTLENIDVLDWDK